MGSALAIGSDYMRLPRGLVRRTGLDRRVIAMRRRGRAAPRRSRAFAVEHSREGKRTRTLSRSAGQATTSADIGGVRVPCPRGLERSTQARSS
jgi:hypothetical protein